MTLPPPTLMSYERAFMHTATRARERYGLAINLREYLAACEQCAEAWATGWILALNEQGRALIRVTMQGQRVRAIYCPGTRLIVTVLEAGHKINRRRDEHKARQRRVARRRPYKRPKYRRFE